VTSLARYLSDIGKYSILTKEQEMEIARAVKKGGNGANLNKLVEPNLSFVVKIAAEYRNMGLPFEDLVSEGNVGLMEAARRYDYTRGTKFITYGVWWIRRSILKALSEKPNLVRVPRYRMKKVMKIRETEASLSRELGRRPDREEISSRLQSTVSGIDEILMIKSRELSLDDRVGREEMSISNYLVDGNSVNPEEKLLRIERNDLMRWAMYMLSDREKIVIRKRFGMQGGRSFTLKEIGETLGLCRERIRQIETEAMRKLRRIFEYHSSPPRAGVRRRLMVPLSMVPPPKAQRPGKRRGRKITPAGSLLRGARTPATPSAGPIRSPARG
jgi:RNA polymerase primary sigma factor